jgi:hypothetical protein
MAAWVGAGALALGVIIGGVTVHVATAQPVAVETCGFSHAAAGICDHIFQEYGRWIQCLLNLLKSDRLP